MLQTANPVITHIRMRRRFNIKGFQSSQTGRLRFLVRFGPSGMPTKRALASARALARSVSAEARNPKWTSRSALELDIFCPTRADFDLFIAAASPVFEVEFTRDLNVAPAHRSEEELFTEAREYFNSERYWECHEVLEGIWRQRSGQEKSLLQGIILLCAAFVHHQKGEESVAQGVLRRALAQLDFPQPEYGGFDVRRLHEQSDQMLKRSQFEPFRV